MDVVVETDSETCGYLDSGMARYLREVGRSRLLSRREEKSLLQRARHGDRQALNELVTGNLKWVVTVSAEYADRGLPMPDLIAEGNLGLIRAAVSFDPDQAFRFTAYAIWWIRRGLEKALADQARRLEQPGIVEEGERKGPVPAAPGTAPRGAALDPRLSPEVRQALEGVREPGRTILKLCFGLDARRPLSVEEIARFLGLDPGRIRGLKERALRRLQSALSAPAR